MVIVIGTNFYIRSEKLWNDCKEFEEKYGIYVSAPEIHIAKTSCGWKPLFQKNLLFSSVKDIKEFYDKSGLEIFDEYGKKYNWEEFTKRVLKFCENGKTHIEYEGYTVDSDGYEFMDGEWS